MSTLVGTETLTLSGSGTVADKNIGSGKAVTLGSLALGDGTNGGLASNYTLTGGTHTATITVANLQISGISASNKVYNGTTSATLTGTPTVTPLGTDVVSVTGSGTGTFSNKDVGNGKSVTVTGYSLTGADSGNYTPLQPAGLTANISAYVVSLTGNRVYDASVNVAAGIFSMST
jgi:hypothetical protein